MLQIVTALRYGGLERTTFDVSAALVRAGGRALIAAPETSAALRLRASGAELIPFTPGARGATPAALARIAAEAGVDIIHARSRAGADLGLAAARIAGLRFVTTWPRVYQGGRDASALKAGDPIVAVSDHVARHLAEVHGCGADRVVVIPRGVDMAAFSENGVSAGRAVQLAEMWGLAEDARPVILAPGRLAPDMGLEALARIAAHLRASRGDDFLVLVVGEDERPYADRLQRAIVEAGAAGVMRVAGPTPDMPAALKLASVVVSAAETPQSSARVVVEAASMGRPVVAMDHGAVSDVVKHAETGWLIPPGDEAGFAAGLDLALGLDESARAHVSLSGRALVRSRFTLEAMQAAMLEVYGAGVSAGASGASPTAEDPAA